MTDYTVECPQYYYLLQNINELGLMKDTGKFMPVTDLAVFLVSFRNKQISLSRIYDILVNGLSYIHDNAMSLIHFMSWSCEQVGKLVRQIETNSLRKSWNIDNSYDWTQPIRGFVEYQYVPQILLRFFTVSNSTSGPKMHLNQCLFSYFFPPGQTFRSQPPFEAVATIIVAVCFAAADWWTVQDVQRASTAYWSAEGISRMTSSQSSLLMTPSLVSEMAMFAQRCVPAGFNFDFWEIHAQQRSDTLLKVILPPESNLSGALQTGTGERRRFFGVDDNHVETHVTVMLSDEIEKKNTSVIEEKMQKQPSTNFNIFSTRLNPLANRVNETAEPVSSLQQNSTIAVSSSGQQQRQKEAALSGPKAYLAEHEAYFFLVQCPQSAWLKKLTKTPKSISDQKVVSRRGCFTISEKLLHIQMLKDSSTTGGLKPWTNRTDHHHLKHNVIASNDDQFSGVVCKNALYEMDNWMQEIIPSPDAQLKELSSIAYNISCKNLQRGETFVSNSGNNNNPAKDSHFAKSLRDLNQESNSRVLTSSNLQKLLEDLPLGEFYAKMHQLFAPTFSGTVAVDGSSPSEVLLPDVQHSDVEEEEEEGGDEHVPRETQRSKLSNVLDFSSKGEEQVVTQSKVKVKKEFPILKPRGIKTLYKQPCLDPAGVPCDYALEKPVTLAEVKVQLNERALQLRQSGLPCAAAGVDAIGPEFGMRIEAMKKNRARYGGSSLGKFTMKNVVRGTGWSTGPWTFHSDPAAHNREIIAKLDRKKPVQVLWKVLVLLLAMRRHVRKRMMRWGKNHCRWKVKNVAAARELVKVALKKLETYEEAGGPSAVANSRAALLAAREKMNLAHLATPCDRITSLVFAFKPTRADCVSASRHFASEFKRQSLQRDARRMFEKVNHVLKIEKEGDGSEKGRSSVEGGMAKTLKMSPSSVLYDQKNDEKSKNEEIEWIFPAWCPRGTIKDSLYKIQRKNAYFKEEIVPSLVEGGRERLKAVAKGPDFSKVQTLEETKQIIFKGSPRYLNPLPLENDLAHEDHDMDFQRHTRAIKSGRKTFNSEKQKNVHRFGSVNQKIHRSWIEDPLRLPLYF